MKFSEFSTYLIRLEKTASRLEITDILADLIKKLDVSEIEQAINLMLGVLGPAFSAPVFNVAEQVNIVAISKAFGKENEEIKTRYKKLGDLGEAAESFSKNTSSNLNIKQVFNSLLEIANFEGNGSVERKVNGLADLYKNLDKNSLRFVARIPIGKLRLGFSDKTIIDALAIAETGDKTNKNEIEAAFAVVPDIAKLAYNIKSKGLKKATQNVNPIIGIPVIPALAQRLKSPDEMIEKMGEVSIEPKFDGLRVFIHFDKNGVHAFTRNLNEVSEMFPEIKNISKYLNAKSVILDTEAIGVDPKTEKFLDFQHTMQRRRKHDIENSSKNIPLTFQVFDVLYLNGKNLMNKEYLKRREVLEKLFKKNKLFAVDEKTITKDPNVIRSKHKEYLNRGLEGVIVKKADSKYVSGRTGWRWVKMKEEESSHAMLSDTIDAVVLGYTQGRGKRAKFGIGQFLAGVRKGDKFLSMTKVGTGLTDEQFIELHKKLSKIKVKNKPKNYEVAKELEPDFWVEPKVVVELAADEITRSSKHAAGLALRFPRLVKFRDDKNASQATTLKELKNI